MKRINIVMIILVAIISACSTTKKIEKSTNKIESIPVSVYTFKNLSIKSSITSVFNNQKLSGSAKIAVASIDSVSMTVFGPMSILVGKLFSTNDYFLFYNVMGDEAFEGNPKAENLKRAIMMPLSYLDFVKLIRCEVPGNPLEYIKDNISKSNDGSIFKCSKNNDYTEFGLFNADSTLKQYQRLLKDGTLIMNVQFEEYVINSGFKYPKKISFKFPTISGSFTLEIDDVVFNETFSKPFEFKIPKTVKTYKI